MAVDSLSVIRTGVYGAYYDPKKAGKKSINPRKDKVYVDPKTGEYTTWKPGIYNPKQEETNKAVKTATTVAALAATALLAYIFRGKIKTNGAKLLKNAQPYAQKVYLELRGVANKASNFVNKVIDFAKPYVQKTNNVISDAIKNGSKVFSEKVLAPLKNYFKPAVQAAKKAV